MPEFICVSSSFLQVPFFQSIFVFLLYFFGCSWVFFKYIFFLSNLLSTCHRVQCAPLWHMAWNCSWRALVSELADCRKGNIENPYQFPKSTFLSVPFAVVARGTYIDYWQLLRSTNWYHSLEFVLLVALRLHKDDTSEVILKCS